MTLHDEIVKTVEQCNTVYNQTGSYETKVGVLKAKAEALKAWAIHAKEKIEIKLTNNGTYFS
jgi:hypothetical protein